MSIVLSPLRDFMRLYINYKILQCIQSVQEVCGASIMQTSMHIINIHGGIVIRYFEKNPTLEITLGSSTAVLSLTLTNSEANQFHIACMDYKRQSVVMGVDAEEINLASSLEFNTTIYKDQGGSKWIQLIPTMGSLRLPQLATENIVFQRVQGLRNFSFSYKTLDINVVGDFELSLSHRGLLVLRATLSPESRDFLLSRAGLMGQ